MRQLSELIDEAKFNTNTEKSSKFSESAMVRLFDTAQRTIRMIIHNAYPTEPILAKIKTYTIENDIEFLKLPKDMLTPNAIHNVTPIRNNSAYGESLSRISLGERSNTYGYYIVNDKLYMNPSDYFKNYRNSLIEVSYAAELKRLTSKDQTSELPTICEEFMILWVEKKINYIKSSRDFASSQIFNKEQKMEITELFADAARDPKMPPMTNSDYAAY